MRFGLAMQSVASSCNRLGIATALLCCAACDRYARIDRYAGLEQSATVPMTHSSDSIDGSPDDDHVHRDGVNGGVLASLGRDEYHAEAVVQDDGSFSIYILGADETRIQEVSHQLLTAYAKPDDGGRSSAIILKADPLPGDAEGRTSRFTGKLPAPLLSRLLSITVPGLRIEDERFAARFTIPPSAALTMPIAADDDRAKALYLTAGGLYSDDDIIANGRMTAGDRYRGFHAEHDANPAPGDAVCPITHTKANPNCSWIIGGETYSFCCPPCIDEFVAMAKTNPEKLLAPGAYVQPGGDSRTEAAVQGEAEVGDD